MEQINFYSALTDDPSLICNLKTPDESCHKTNMEKWHNERLFFQLDRLVTINFL